MLECLVFLVTALLVAVAVVGCMAASFASSRNFWRRTSESQTRNDLEDTERWERRNEEKRRDYEAVSRQTEFWRNEAVRRGCPIVEASPCDDRDDL